MSTTHYIITNRRVTNNTINNDGKEEASDEIRFATYDIVSKKVTLTKDFKGGNHSSILIPTPENPYLGILNKKKENLAGSAFMFRDLYDKMLAEKGDVLFFIHGFNTDFDDSLGNIEMLTQKYIKKGSPIKHIVMFSWPARSNLLRYRDDARDAEQSGFALGRAYQMLIDFFRAIFGYDPNKPEAPICNNNIHLMCHSMGNRVFENMVKSLFNGRNFNTTIFKEIILIASDIDWSCLEEPNPLNKVTNICERVHVYFHNKDRALFISETTKNAYNRLGKYGARDQRKVPSHIHFVDCTAINDETSTGEDLIHHWYYYESKKVIADIIEVLNGEEAEEIKGGRNYVSAGKFRIK
jgi:esterase/lipase superfamily enzyme